MKLFKRIVSVLLCPIMTLCTCACATVGQSDASTTDSQPETIDPNTPLSDGKTLKLLAITSSFGQNTTDLLYDIAKAEGCTDVVVGRLYASGCTLEKHVSNAQTNAAAYTYTKNSTGSWKKWKLPPCFTVCKTRNGMLSLSSRVPPRQVWKNPIWIIWIPFFPT